VLEEQMIAGVYNITCEQGSTFTRTFTITDPDGGVYDLTGFAARMHIRRDFDSASTMFQATTANGCITISTVFGEIHVDLTAAQTATITRDGVYDLEIYNDEGIVYKVVKGRFILDKEVTR
jgi:hypothetical protein